MPRRVVVVLVLLVSAAVTVQAARSWIWSPVDRIPGPPGRELAAPLRSAAEHDELWAVAAFPYFVSIRRGAGHIVVAGTRHTTDPSDPQLIALAAAFDELRPQLVLIEGSLGWHLGGRDSAVRRFGEFGAAAALAYDAGVPVRSLEPEFADEIEDVEAAFGAQRTLAFYFLRVFLGDRDRDSLGDDPDAAARRLLSKRAARLGLTDALPDLAAFEAFWAREFPDGPAWRELPEEALWRNRDGTWLQAIAERLNRFRDMHAIAVLLDQVERGDRVLAVTGASHAIIQEPALRAGAAK